MSRKTYKPWIHSLLLIPLIPLFLLSPPVAAAAAAPDDATITFWAGNALFDDPRINSANMDVSTRQGIVTLSGTVRNLAAKKFARLEVEKIRGVRGVIDQLIVEPVARRDGDIQKDVAARLRGNALLHDRHLDVTVRKGEVSLDGTVDSWNERQVAGQLASAVLGVRRVQNNLGSAYHPKRPDAEIQKDVSAALGRDVYLAGLPIAVSVTAGVATLSGEVGNAYEKERAGDDAWVWNVDDVVNRLAVVAYEAQGVRKKIPLPPDSALQREIGEELKQDARLRTPADIRVESTLGHVILRGRVPTYYQKWVAGQDARDVVGVAWVSNLLLVNQAWRDDAAVQADVRNVLASDYLLSGQDVRAGVHEGVVTLTGSVNTLFEKSRASELAATVLGAGDVINALRVNRQQKYSGAALKKRIQARLAANWTTHGIARDIRVDVAGGRATLTGVVNTFAQRNEASRLAFLTDGIWAVRNHLTVLNANYPWKEWYVVSPDTDDNDSWEHDNDDYYFYVFP